MFETVKQALLKEIQDAKSCYSNPPPNEACTCDWVILPILHAAGYAKMDIISQAGNLNGGYPDYTILPNTLHTWYLEAKDWKKSLENGPEAVQALNYANAHGHRWVVLSNGREWLLFDNHIQGVEASGRIVARAEITSPEFLEFMAALSKASVQSAALEDFANKSRLRSIVTEQLTSKDSVLTKVVSSTLKNKIGLTGVQPSDVAAFFAETLGAAMSSGEIFESGPGDNSGLGVAGASHSLAELQTFGSAVWNHKPVAVILPCGTTAQVASWRDVASQVVQWIGKEKGLPGLPFRGSESGQRWFLSTEPVHADGKPMDSRMLTVQGQQVYMDVHMSSSSFAIRLCALCRAAGVPADGFAVSL